MCIYDLAQTGLVPKAHPAHKLFISETPQESLNDVKFTPLCMPISKPQGDYALRFSLPAPCFPPISTWDRVFLSYGFRNAIPEGPKKKAYFLQIC